MARILVIDDEPLVRGAIRRVLESASHEIVEAVNGQEGLTQQRAQAFDLVITDIIMPEKEGIATITELKAEYPSLPVIAISGGGIGRYLEYLKVAEVFGADHTLIKPFNSEELIAAVDNCLG